MNFILYQTIALYVKDQINVNFTGQVTGYQVHVIEKAIISLFTKRSYV